MAGSGAGLRFADDFFDSHEACEVGAFQFVHAHDDVSDGFFDCGDEDVFERVDSPSCGFDFGCKEFEAASFFREFKEFWQHFFIERHSKVKVGACVGVAILTGNGFAFHSHFRNADAHDVVP